MTTKPEEINQEDVCVDYSLVYLLGRLRGLGPDLAKAVVRKVPLGSHGTFQDDSQYRHAGSIP